MNRYKLVLIGLFLFGWLLIIYNGEIGSWWAAMKMSSSNDQVHETLNGELSFTAKNCIREARKMTKVTGFSIILICFLSLIYIKVKRDMSVRNMFFLFSVMSVIFYIWPILRLSLAFLFIDEVNN